MTIEHVALDALDDLVASGELTDAKSIIGLSLARRRDRARGPTCAIRTVRSASPLPLEVEDFLTWLSVERGRGRQHRRRLPPGPGRLPVLVGRPAPRAAAGHRGAAGPLRRPPAGRG